MTDNRLGMLKEIIDDATSTDNIQQLLELNNSFHATVYEAFDQAYLVAEIQKMRNRVAPYNRLYLDTKSHKRDAWDDHRRIYEACIERDGAKAAEATCKHLDRVLNALAKSLA